MKQSDEVMVEEEYIHEFFGLSYSNYLVLPRTILQSAPAEWQKRFVGMLDELEEMFPGQGGGKYWVRKREGNKFVHDPLANYERGRRKISYIGKPNATT